MRNWTRRLFGRSRAEKELDSELRFHVEQQIADFIASAMDPNEARRRAHLAFGGLEQIKQDTREGRWETHLENVFRDFRFALRGLRREWRFALVAIFTLALGIGAATIMFSVVDGVLLEPFPYKNVGRLATFQIHFPSKANSSDRHYFGAPEFLGFKHQNHVFEDMIGIAGQNILYAGTNGRRRFAGGMITSNAFEILGVKPLLGRPITLQDGDPASPPVFAMSYSLWVREFDRNPKILGATFNLDGNPKTLVAIMPPRFRFGDYDLWVPVTLEITVPSVTSQDRGPWFWPIGVLKPGVTLATAAADFDVIARAFAKLYPGGYLREFSVEMQTFADSYVSDVKGLLYTLMAAVAMLLLIACGNVANLLLSRSTMRGKEIAIRAAIGASRARLFRQLLAESLVLASAGCMAGCWLAYFGMKAIVAVIPQGTIPSEAVVTLNPAALWFALGITLLITLLCGLAPAIHAIRGGWYPRVVGNNKGAGGNLRHGRLRAALVVAEVGLSLVLLMGSGLMVQTLLALEHVKLGFDPRNVLCARLYHPRNYLSPNEKKLFYRAVLDRVAEMPGVSSASAAIRVPPSSVGLTDVSVPGKESTESSYAVSEMISEDYFQTLGIPLLRGRVFSKAEIDSARVVVVVNQSFARTFFPDADPIGRKVKFPSWETNYSDWPRGAYLEIIGVVGDVKNDSLRTATSPEIYLPYSISATSLADDRVILIKTAGHPESLLPSLNKVIHKLDADVAVIDTGTIEDSLREESYSQPRFGFIIMSVFAGMGLLLVIVGVFSVMAYTVSLRTREIGIRMALGAQRGDVSRMVLRNGLSLVAAGAILGVVTSIALTRLLAGQIWGVSATDPWTFGLVVVVILIVGLAACLVPARRATQVDPMIALRFE